VWFATRGERLSSHSGKVSFLAVKAVKTSTIDDSGKEIADVRRRRKHREPLKVTQPFGPVNYATPCLLSFPYPAHRTID
jgi:Tfp pilus assembly protein PilP